MRISTLQSFNVSLDNMLEQQARLERSEQQIATGLRILEPSDDPNGAARVVNLEANLAVIEQFTTNSAVAQSQLSLEESVLDNLGNNLQRLRELTVQAANATNTTADRQAIASEVRGRLGELLALANTRDSSGEYIFAGYSVGAVPFVDNGSGVSYTGDQGQRMLQVGESTQIAVRDSGADVFLRVPTGNGSIEALPAAANTGSLVVGSYGLNGSFVPDTYSIDFVQAVPTDPITYTVTDSAATVVASGTYQPDQDIQFASVQVGFSGVPADGDSVSVAASATRSIFDTVEALATALEQPTTTSTGDARLQNSLNRALNDLEQALEHGNDIRAQVGARLNIIDNQRELNEDFNVQLQTVLSETRDLDYTEAISHFNLQLNALQAAQQAYVKLQELSLFKFL